jgi:hypothetical protein
MYKSYCKDKKCKGCKEPKQKKVPEKKGLFSSLPKDNEFDFDKELEAVSKIKSKNN